MMQPSRDVRGVPFGCPLSPREYEVVVGLAASQTYAQIGLSLGISESCVRSLAHRGYKRINVSNRANAVIKCWQQGWIGIAGVVPVTMGDEPPDPEVTPEIHAYLVAFMRWLKDPSPANLLTRRQALSGIHDTTAVAYPRYRH